MTGEIWLRIAAISGFLTVALGAFGAHGPELVYAVGQLGAAPQG